MKRLAVVSCLCLWACGGLTCDAKRHKAIRYMNMGIEKFTDGLHAAAVRDLKAAVREDDSFGKAHYNLAKVYQHMNKWDDAQRHLNRVIGLEPDNATLYYELGRCYHNLNRLDMASSAYEKALGLKPKLYVAHYRLGKVHKGLDQPKLADDSFRKAIEINPRFTKAFVSLGNLYLDYDYPELAMRVLQAGVSINDSDPAAHNALGVAYQYLTQYDKAMEAFRKALDADGGFYVALYNLGVASAAAGRNKEAEKHLNRFTKVAPGKKDIDPDYVRQAHEKLMELSGVMEAGGAKPPSR